MPAKSEQDELTVLRAENDRLRALLAANGIEVAEKAQATQDVTATRGSFTTAEKIKLFRSLFRGRSDVYAVRWESATTGKSGYSPVCANEWKPVVCEKPRVKCGDCRNRALTPVSDPAIFDHLSGKQTLGVYPLTMDGRCSFLAVDFDDEDWREDSVAYFDSCTEIGVPASIEISRSGSGAHVWIFFATPVSAHEARSLGTALISHTCARRKLLKLTSYDRLFPNQDNVPSGGFGNLIALPLQKHARESGASVFVDRELRPYQDQWAFLASIERLSLEDVAPAIARVTGDAHPLDVAFIDDENQNEPWKMKRETSERLSGEMPAALRITLVNKLYVEKSVLPPPLANRLIRLAAFQNPEFYKAQAMRFPVWDKPRVIGCAENFPQHIALPRGCYDALLDVLSINGIALEITDERFAGSEVNAVFRGRLRIDQELAVAQMTEHDIGILSAWTGFGKTVAAAAIIARRGVNTLILVHRTELLRQWKAALSNLLDAADDLIGTIGGGRGRITGKIDIAVIQSLTRKGDVKELVEDYGQIIVDECHHIGAVSFDNVLRAARAKFVLGLTATPVRRDGHQPIIFMQCGPIRHRAAASESASHDLRVIAREVPFPRQFDQKPEIQSILRNLAEDTDRIAVIVDESLAAFREGRKILVLTERTSHAEAIYERVANEVSGAFLLHGRLGQKARTAVMKALEELDGDEPRIIVATGRLIGEGFDHPPLDTLVLAMPISWKGTLQQYAGRLSREHAGKTSVRIIDLVDTGHPMLLRMWKKRNRAYRQLGFKIEDAEK